ncbi:unnamed protein product [Durusdinium trenchii]
MPFPPARVARVSRTPPLFLEAETPRKLPRPTRRRVVEDEDRVGGNPQSSEPALCDAEATSCPGSLFGPLLPTVSLLESLAHLEVQDLLSAAAVCAAWRSVVASSELWSLTVPHLRLADRAIQKSRRSTRRSRGTVDRGILLGKERQEVALRTLDLERNNGNTSDGLLPSVLREVGFLHAVKRAQHLNFLRLIEVEVVPPRVFIATEYVPCDFSAWFRRVLPRLRLQAEIRAIFSQLLEAVAFLHDHGIFGRNLRPSNVLITCDGVVKLCDLCYGRGMDEPLRPYTPLEERVRDLSGREKCKLRYLAPEMILRKEVYGPAIDIWAVGCLLAEACLQDALFSADDEIGHLFQIFRLLGTPGPNHWPEAVCSKIFSVKFPQWPPFDFRRTVAGGPEAILLLQDLANRMDVYNKVSTLGRVLGASGIDLFSTLLRLDPAERCTASRALQCSFFQESRESRRRSRSRSEPQRRTRHKSQHSQDSQPVDDRELAWLGQLSQEMSSQSQATPATGLAQILAHFQLCTQSQRSFRIWRTEWPAVWTGLVREDLAWRPRSAPVSELAAKMNAQQVNFVVDMSRSLFLDEQLVNEHTLHLAVAYLQDFNSLPPPRGGPGLHGDLVALACLKMADSMNEVANEFFQRGRMESFTQIQGRWTAEEIMKAEVIIFHRLQSRLHRPTAGWFLHTSLAFGGFKDVRVKHVAKYINMLSLYDVDMQDHPAHLRAMASLLLAVYTCLASGPSSPAEDRGFWKQVRASGASIEALVPIFTRMCQLLTTQRFHWAAQGLDAVDRRYPEAPRCLPCHFSPNLADEFLQPLLRHVKSDRSLPSGAQ